MGAGSVAAGRGAGSGAARGRRSTGLVTFREVTVGQWSTMAMVMRGSALLLGGVAAARRHVAMIRRTRGTEERFAEQSVTVE